MKSSFVILALYLVVAASHVYPEDTPMSAEDLNDHSRLWPFHVQIDPKKVEPRLEPATRFPGILLRVDGGMALVDLGRDGTHRIPVEDTNLLQEAGRIKRGEAELDLPNFTRYTANIFMRKNAAGLYRPYPVDTYASTSLFLLVYGDESLVANDVLRQSVTDLFETSKKKGAMNVVMPTTDRFYDQAITAGVDWIFPFAHSRIAYLDALHHYPEENAITVVLVDAYGKILERSVVPKGGEIAGLHDLNEKMDARLKVEPEPVREKEERSNLSEGWNIKSKEAPKKSAVPVFP